MDYPIYDNSREIGRLLSRQDGLYTVFEARLPKREGLTRLYLCGAGGSRLLGVMEPGREGCVLCRRLSRRELPEGIEYASTAPGHPAPVKEKARENDGWTEGAGGLLYHAQRRLLAIPAGLRRDCRTVRILTIRGKEYVVFRW